MIVQVEHRMLKYVVITLFTAIIPITIMKLEVISNYMPLENVLIDHSQAS